MNEIPRVISPDQSTAISAAKTMVLTIPRDLDYHCSALAVYPGMGEHWRLQDAIHVWHGSQLHGGSSIKHFLVAGTQWQKEKTDIRPVMENLVKEPFWIKITEDVHTQDHACHTGEQANWLVAKTLELDLKSIALFVSPYHITRAYMTLLKAYLKAGVKPIILIPVPTDIPPGTIIPETGTDAWAMIAGEDARILQYQEKGDCATLEELKTYLDWLWQQQLLSPRRYGGVTEYE